MQEVEMTKENRILELMEGELLRTPGLNKPFDTELAWKLDSYSLESIMEIKISRFLEQLGGFYPESLYALIMKKIEKPLIEQILKRTGNNQVQAARILGINRNTLRKKMRLFSLT